MTTKQIPQAVINMMSASALLKLKVALDIALDNGGFETVIDVCKNLVHGAAKTKRPVGIWADAEWRGFDFLESRLPGCTKNHGKYLPVPLDEEAPVSFEEAIKQLENLKVDPSVERMIAAAGGSLKVGDIANSPDFTEEEKSTMLRALGYQYP